MCMSHRCESQRTALGTGPPLPPHLSLFITVCTRLTHLQTSRDTPIPASHLVLGPLGFQTSATNPGFRLVLAIWTQVPTVVLQALLPTEPCPQPRAVLFLSYFEHSCFPVPPQRHRFTDVEAVTAWSLFALDFTSSRGRPLVHGVWTYQVYSPFFHHVILGPFSLPATRGSKTEFCPGAPMMLMLNFWTLWKYSQLTLSFGEK